MALTSDLAVVALTVLKAILQRSFLRARRASTLNRFINFLFVSGHCKIAFNCYAIQRWYALMKLFSVWTSYPSRNHVLYLSFQWVINLKLMRCIIELIFTTSNIFRECCYVSEGKFGLGFLCKIHRVPSLLNHLERRHWTLASASTSWLIYFTAHFPGWRFWM